MALATKLGGVIPEGAIAVSQEEALEHQKSVVRNWPVETDVIFLKYGYEIAFGTTLVSSLTIFEHFRRVMNVQKKLYSLLLAPTFLVPAYISGRGAEKFITENTLLMKIKCPMCNQLKFTLLQCYCGMVHPIMYGLGSFTLISNLTNTYNFTRANTNPKLFWTEMYKFVKSGARSYQIAGIMQCALILSLPYMQARELLKITEKLNQDIEFLEV